MKFARLLWRPLSRTLWTVLPGGFTDSGLDTTNDILLEDGSFLLLESGDKLLLEA